MDTKIRYEIEFPINSSPQLLYQYISTPSGLSEWFADNVNSRGEFFTFIWNDSEEKARLCSKKSGEKVRFKWVDDNNKDTEFYFELHILVDEITKDVSLTVIDFADIDEVSEAKLLWENQISDLKHVIGSV
ncbi:START-like domain-containing protein [Flavobacterium sp.]|uniref:START-like domain-containing protein n=1 Tax=Flavobacterium sp. TaxID=239 RepID=UPI00286E38D4|nr:START-like domain-containing protein [Flavobacterium sp.]